MSTMSAHRTNNPLTILLNEKGKQNKELRVTKSMNAKRKTSPIVEKVFPNTI